MKSAKEMFEKLDYNNTTLFDEKEIVYNKNLQHTNSYYRYISFNKKTKTLELDDNSTQPFYLSFEELQAINKQVEELGWLDEQSK